MTDLLVQIALERIQKDLEYLEKLTDGNCRDSLHMHLPRVWDAVTLAKQQQTEMERLTTPPDNDAWKSVIRLAYADGGDGVHRIHQITSDYIRMRDYLAVARADNARLTSALIACFKAAIPDAQLTLSGEVEQATYISKMLPTHLEGLGRLRISHNAEAARLREALLIQRGCACRLTDFMYGAVRECAADMIQHIDAALSDSAEPAKESAEQGHGSGPMPGRGNMTVVQTGKKTLFVRMPKQKDETNKL